MWINLRVERCNSDGLIATATKVSKRFGVKVGYIGLSNGDGYIGFFWGKGFHSRSLRWACRPYGVSQIETSNGPTFRMLYVEPPVTLLKKFTQSFFGRREIPG